MTDKEIIDEERMFECVWCKYSFKESDANFILSENPNECICSGCITEWADNLLCDLKRKEQECEQIKEKYEALKLENQEGYEIVAELKHEYEGLKKQLETAEEWRIKAESLNEKLSIEKYRYRKALEEIEKQCKCYGRSKYTQEFDREYGGELDTNILDIINKAKGEGC